MPVQSGLIHLKGTRLDALIDLSHGAPVITYWGAPLRSAHNHPWLEADSSQLKAALDRPVVHATVDTVAPVSVVPEHGSGFHGRPGILGCRPDGQGWAPRFEPAGHTYSDDDQSLRVEARDEVAGLLLTTTITVGHTLDVQVALTNLSDVEAYLLHGLSTTIAVPDYCSEMLTFTGRWSRELHPRRVTWGRGAQLRENRRGRTSHQNPPLLFVGTPGFGEFSGEIWGAHLAWSGNSVVLADRLADGRRYLQLGELLHPGEVALAPGATYVAPKVVAVYSDAGLNAATQRFHRRLRERPQHPRTARPVVCNTWEAVYFDHDFTKLCALADRAARVGVERFVLDDGWFGSRRDDTSGLGDWEVSPEAHPHGLAPLIEHVKGLGMTFGIWVEPEMVNPDSDLYRAHPEWALTTDGYELVTGRNQLVLDLANPAAFDHILGRLDALLRDHEISFLKWDMNRDHIGGSGVDGSAGSHTQAHALYELIDTLRDRHRNIEIESCASGGGRIDHEILQRCERVWTSDCIDALERQRIQQGASMLIPPEMVGCHVGPEVSATTGRRHSLSFRGLTALFGHMGVECNLLELSDSELDALAQIISLHKRFRGLLHAGDVVRFDTEDAYVAHGVYDGDRLEALISFSAVATSPSLTPPRLYVRGLTPDVTYSCEVIGLPGESAGPAKRQPRWTSVGVRLKGEELERLGLQPPALHPATGVLIHLVATDA